MNKARATLPRVARLFWSRRRRLALLATVVILAAVSGVGASLLIKPIFDRALYCDDGCPKLPLLGWLVAAMLTLTGLAAVLGYWHPRLSIGLGQGMIRDLRDSLYAHLQRMPIRFFTQTRQGEIQSRLSNDVGGIERAVTESVPLVLNDVVRVVSALAAMAVLSWQLTGFSVALIPVFAWAFRRVGDTRRAAGNAAQSAKAELTTHTEQTLSVSGALLVRAFGTQAIEIAAYRTASARLAQLEVAQQMVGQAWYMRLRIVFTAMPVLAYLVAGLVLARGDSFELLSAGTLVAFTALQLQLYPTLVALLQEAVDAYSSLAMFERVFEYLDLRPDIVDRPGAIEPPSGQAGSTITLRDVTFRYGHGHGRSALAGVSLTIRAGQLAAVVGASGAGKTTLSYLIPRLYDVDDGAILIDGVDVRDIRLTALAGMVGMVTQETYLLHASIRDNLCYGNPGATDHQLKKAAEAAAIHDRVTQLDEGYDTVVGERGYRMSGGEKQRLALARVILKDPRILILDEATAALDSANEQLVQQALAKLIAGRTTITIAHRLSTVLAADVIFVLDRGRLVEQGTHAELMSQRGVYANLYHRQLSAHAVFTVPR